MTELLGFSVPIGFFYILMGALVVGGAVVALMAARAFLGTLLRAFVPGHRRGHIARKGLRLVACVIVAALGVGLVILAGAPLISLANTLKG